jgi:hypothetical protein
MNEIRLIRSALDAIEAFERLPKTSKRGSAWQLFCVATENALSHEWEERDLTELVYRIARRRDEEEVNP